jgi:hypothetical protein
MDQFLDQKDGKWHITMWMTVPTVNIRHSYNFRVHSITNNDDSIVRDPVISNSHYIFDLGTKFFGKKVFFNVSFDPLEIQNVKSFKFGFCNEQVSWLSNTFFVVENNCPKLKNNNDIVAEEQVSEVKVSDVVEEIISVSNETSVSLDELEPALNEVISAEPFMLSEVILDDTSIELKVELPVMKVENEPSTQQKDVVQTAKKKLGRKKK